MTKRNQPANQQGIALMMTLGVLSLILILAMSFSFTARSSRQLSQNNAEVVRARQLANSGLNRVIAAIGNRFEDYGTTPALIFPATSGVWFDQQTTSPYGDRYFWYSGGTSDYTGIESALTADLNIGPRGFLPFTTVSENIALGTAVGVRPSWQHVLSPIEVDGTADDRIVGRISFLVIDESGKLDPTNVMTLNWEPTWIDSSMRPPTFPAPGAGNFFDLDGDGVWDKTYAIASYVDSARPGLSPQEIRLESSYGANAFWTEVPTVTRSGQAIKTEWFDWRHIAAIGTFSADTWTQTVANETFRRYFPYSYDIEAFVYDLDSDPATPLQDAHRFDLWAYDWDGTDWSNTANVQDLYDDANLASFWTGSPGGSINTATASLAAPALGGFTDAATTNRTLVNLADFLDSDNEATIQPSGSYWNATVVGNEEQPYVNEVAFVVNYVRTDPTPPPNSGDETGLFTLNLFLEVANIYDTDKAFTGTVRVTFTLEGTTSTVNIPVSGTALANAYTVVPYQWTQNFAGAATPMSVTFTVSDCRVALLDNWSADSGSLADFAHALDSDITVVLNGVGMGMNMRYASTQVEDPRCNTLPGDWDSTNFAPSSTNVTMTFSVIPGSPPTVNATGEVNEIGGSTADPSSPPTAGSGYDAETIGDPVLGLSTAFIANRADITFWELGAVHRGHPWQTINLKAYNASNTGRSYNQGDAVLLEQIKLGSFNEMRGRVNANSQDGIVWQRVFDGLQVGCTYGDRITDGGTAVTAITTTERDNLATAVATSGINASSRGQIAEIADLSDGSQVGQTTDREQEEIIGKIANLLTVRQNVFTVLVAAQTLLDTGTNNPNTSDSGVYKTVAGNDYYYRVQSEHKLLATVYRDALTNTFRVVNLEHLED